MAHLAKSELPIRDRAKLLIVKRLQSGAFDPDATGKAAQNDCGQWPMSARKYMRGLNLDNAEPHLRHRWPLAIGPENRAAMNGTRSHCNPHTRMTVACRLSCCLDARPDPKVPPLNATAHKSPQRSLKHARKFTY